MERDLTMDEAQEAKPEVSRRQLLAGGAGLAGILAGAGLLSRGETALAAAGKQASTHFARDITAGGGIFLKFDPLVLGEAVSKRHMNEIDVISFSFGGTNPHIPPTNSTSRSIPIIQDLSLLKHVDRASIGLFTLLRNGKSARQAILAVRDTAPDNPNDVLTITLNNVLVKGLAPSGSTGEDFFTETVTLSFSMISIKYVMPSGQVVSGSWDLRKGPGK